MAEQHASSAHGASHGHSSVKSYMIGFVLAVILTVIPFKIVMDGTMDRGTMLWIVMGMAAVQIVVHLKYFLHRNFTTESGKVNTFSFAFTAMVIVLLVGLSIWIITTADALMLR